MGELKRCQTGHVFYTVTLLSLEWTITQLQDLHLDKNNSQLFSHVKLAYGIMVLKEQLLKRKAD